MKESLNIPNIPKCPHSIPVQEFCENCLTNSKTNQPCWETILKLKEKSRVERDVLEVNCKIKAKVEDKEEEFTIGQIESRNDPALEELLILLDEHFKEDALNSKESFIRKLEGKTKYGKERPQYRCFYIKNQEGKMIALRVSEQFALEGNTEKDETVFYAIYIALNKEYRGTGIVRELYISSLIDAAQEAEKRNKKVGVIIAECSNKTEKLQNQVGLKRVYFDKDEKLTEFKYHQPPMEFDPKTGEKLSGEPAEHLMIYDLMSEALTKERLENSLKSLYKQYQNGWPKESFENTEAFVVHQKYYEDLYANLHQEIYENGEIIQMNQSERALAQEGKKEVIEFTEANKD